MGHVVPSNDIQTISAPIDKTPITAPNEIKHVHMLDMDSQFGRCMLLLRQLIVDIPHLLPNKLHYMLSKCMGWKVIMAAE